MRIPVCILAACVAANLSLPCALPCKAAETVETKPSAIVWENGVTPDTPAEEMSPVQEIKTPSVSDDAAAQVAKLVNEEREKAGLSTLAYDADLCKAAEVRAQEIVTSFSHDRPDGSSCFTVLKEMGISYVACGENIAKGSQSPESVMDGWMHSAGHKANILNSLFTKIGVAMAKVGNTRYWVQIFTA